MRLMSDIIHSLNYADYIWSPFEQKGEEVMYKIQDKYGPDKWSEVYSSIILNSPNGVMIIDYEHKIIQCNETIEKLLDISNKSVIGKEISVIFPLIEKEIKEEGNHAFYYPMQNRTLYIKKLSLPEQPADKPVTILLIQDMEEFLTISGKLSNDASVYKQLKIIFEKSFDGILVTDGKGNVIMVNESYERLTGIKKSEMIGKNMIELLNADWMRESVVFPVIERRTPVSMTHTTKNGKNIIVTGVPVFEMEKISMVIINARDVSEMYELKEELMKSKEMEKLYFNQLKDKPENCAAENVIVVSPVMKEIYSLAKKISPFNTNVLILGESGVGKEEVAKYIHKHSRRNNKPFVVINCAAIPESLLESELFGYEKGAFTGAEREKEGLFETADSGTLFLDEIGDMSPVLQVKLLRFLETRKITRVGGTKPISVDVRLLAATNKDLKAMSEEGSFREDLYYRLNVVEINIPPLRRRIEDIGPLCLYFINELNKKYGQNKKITYDVIRQMEEKVWTGNVRELKNAIERMIVISNNEYLQISDMYTNFVETDNRKETLKNKIKVDGIMPLNDALDEVEHQILVSALDKYKSTRKIADALKITQSTVVYKLRKHNLSKEQIEKKSDAKIKLE